MGIQYTYDCKNCLQPGSLIIASGMSYYDYDNVKGDLHWQFRRQLEVFEKTNGETCKEYSYNLYTCTKCKTIHSRFWLKAISKNGEIFETIFKCPKCKKRLHNVPEKNFNIINYACQKCGEFEIAISLEILWD